MTADLSITIWPLIAGILIILSHVPLGNEVFRRQIIFIDISLAQFATLGIIIAKLLHLPKFFEFSLPYIVAIIAASILSKTDTRFRHCQEAIIGSSFIFASCLCLILLNYDPHGATELKYLLEGNLIFASKSNIAFLLLSYIMAIFILLIFKKNISKIFYIIFAIIVTSSVKIAGIYLVFSFLIIPAFFATKFTNFKHQYISGTLISITSLIIGIAISLKFDIAIGLSTSLALIMISIFSCFIAGNVQKVKSQT